MLRQHQARNDQRADPLPRSITLEIPRSLLTGIRDLATTGIDGDGHALGESLDALIGDLSRCVPSYRGLQLTVSRNGFPVVLTTFSDNSDGLPTSLRIPLALLNPDFEAASRIVFYAGTAGALVDLAADLQFVLSGGSTAGLLADHGAARIQLDDDPPPPTRGFSLSGLTELSAIERAVGVLIGQGHHSDHVYTTLRRDAARAGLEPHEWAAELLLRTRTRRPE